MEIGINTCRSLRISNGKLKKNLQRLSSALRINQAGDGAAELAISEKMKAQISVTAQARINLKDGISLVQTAKGATDEMHEMLRRMMTLAEQSANGVYDDDVDRGNLQKEFQKLTEEIDRIAETANFNGIKLLDGSLAAETEWKEDQIYVMESQVTGAVEKLPVDGPPSWEGTIDLSNATDGSVISIDGVNFELDFDNSVMSGNQQVDIKGAASKAACLQTAIQNHSTLKACLKASEVDGQKLKIKLERAAGTGGKFFVDAADNGEAERIASEVNVSIGGNSRIKRLSFENLDLNCFQDGMIVEIFGEKFEIDFDGNTTETDSTRVLTAMNGTVPYDVTHKNSSGVYDEWAARTSKLQAAIKSKMKEIAETKTPKPSSTSLLLMSGVTSKYQVTLTFRNISAEELDFYTNNAFKLHASDCTPKVECTKEFDGVPIPGSPAQNASRADEVNFAAFADGDVIELNGDKYELDSDGKLADSANIAVDISGVKEPSEIGALLVEAVKAQTSAYTVTAQRVDEDRVKLEVTSATQTDGEKMEVSYQVAALNGSKKQTGLKIASVPPWGGSQEAGWLYINLDGLSASDLKLDTIDVATQDDAMEAVGVIKAAVNKVSDNVGTLGAMENRMEHSLNSLGVMQENLTDAESVITSTDMAEEVMDRTKNTITAQAAQSMLAQAMNLMRSKVQTLLQF